MRRTHQPLALIGLENGFAEQRHLTSGIPTARADVMPLRDLADAESVAVDYARTLGIEGADAATLASLRAIPAATLNKDVEWYQSPVIDGRLVVEAPETVLRAGRQAKVPVIVGANDLDMAGGQANSKDELFAAFGPMAPQARALYDPEGDATLAALNQAAFADRTMVEPSRHLAELTTKARPPAYLYRFSCVCAGAPSSNHSRCVPRFGNRLCLRPRCRGHERRGERS